jgi:hypothetical protein
MIQNKTEVLNLKSRKTQVPIRYLTLSRYHKYATRDRDTEKEEIESYHRVLYEFLRHVQVRVRVRVPDSDRERD